MHLQKAFLTLDCENSKILLICEQTTSANQVISNHSEK
jgi:hypothetical protein